MTGAGLPGIRAAWPADDVQPSRKELIALQHRLAALGYKIVDFDGHFDFELRDAVPSGSRLSRSGRGGGGAVIFTSPVGHLSGRRAHFGRMRDRATC